MEMVDKKVTGNMKKAANAAIPQGALNSLEMERYNRQMLLSQVGTAGQIKLKNAKVLIIGAGGLGSPAAFYLTGAGVGTVGIADMDKVDISNLHRQILHGVDSIGVNKARSAKKRLLGLNPETDIRIYEREINRENINEIIRDYDFIVDAVDNFKGKLLINDACVGEKKAFCHAGVTGLRGQVFTYVPGKGPCCRCIFGEAAEEAMKQDNKKMGILGPVAGIIGSIEAMEAVKYLLGMEDELLTGRMFILDGGNMETRIAEFPKRNPRCRACKEAGK